MSSSPLHRRRILIPSFLFFGVVFSVLALFATHEPFSLSFSSGERRTVNLRGPALQWEMKRQSPGFPFSNASSDGPSTIPVFPSPNVTATGVWTSAIKKAQAFVAQLTLEEKVNLTTGVDINGRCVGNTGQIPRLNFAGLCLEDSPLGVRLTDYASAFPAGINVAMTWSKTLMEQRGAAMGFEHRHKGVNVALGPMMNMGRVAAGGRNWEGFGGDPFLAGVAGALTTRGIQSQGVIACAKHYVGNEQEHFRGGSLGSEDGQAYSSDISARTLHEIYVWPFAESVRENVGSVMCAYNRVNGTFACENSNIGNGILKEELGFKGFLLSDWAALVSGAPSALAGTDMNQPGFVGYGIGDQDDPDPANARNSFWGAALVDLVRNGTVPEWRVTDMVTRIMAAFFFMGQDNNYPPVNFNFQSKDTIFEGQLENLHVDVQENGKHAALIREIGSASTILLKHNLTVSPLPISSRRGRGFPRNIAILGSDSGPNPDGPNGCANGNTDRGCSQGTLAMGWGSGTAEFPYLVDPLSAIQSWVLSESPDTTVSFLLNDFNLPQAAKIARQADMCMVFVNSDSGEGYIGVDGNQGDRNNLTLWHGGEALIQTTTSQCNNTVVVIHAVGPVSLESFIDNPNVTAVLFAGLPGQESGNSLVDVLKGDVVPSGRLPFTIAKDPFDYSAQVVYAPNTPNQIDIRIPYTEELEIDYRAFDARNITPRFEFGFGLSYTTFQYSALQISKAGSFGKRQESESVSDSETETESTESQSSESESESATSTESAPASTTATDSSSASTSIDTASTATSTATSASTSAVGNLTTFTIVSTISGGVSTVSSSTVAPTATGPIVIPTGTPGGNPILFDDALTVRFNVRNTGGVDGNEVGQVYVGFPAGSGEPPKVLRGFDRKLVSRGQTRTWSVALRNKDLAIRDVVRNKWVIPKGTFTIFVGASSRDIRLTGTWVNQREVVMDVSGS